MHKSTIALMGAGSFAVGVGIGTAIDAPSRIAVTALSTAVILLCFAFGILVMAKKREGWVTCVLIFFLIVGMGRVWWVPVPPPIKFDMNIASRVIVAAEPRLGQDSQLVFTRPWPRPSTVTDLGGYVQLKIPLQPRVQVGDVLEVQCTLRQPTPLDDFRYDLYLKRQGVTALCYFPSFKVVDAQQSWKRSLFAAKLYMTQRVQRVLAAPESAIVLGVLFGLQQQISVRLLEAFRITGTTHLLVISGSHVVMMSVFLTKLFKLMRLRRSWRAVLLILVLTVYWIFTGLQSSALRATLLGVAVVVAELLGRPSSALRLLLFVGAGMLVANPWLLLYDIGFQLSFAASAGLILLTSWFTHRLHWLPNVVQIRELLATTLAATSATAPIIIWNFHIFSVVALVANLIMVPLMTVVMIVGWAVVVVAVISIAVGEIAAIPLYILVHLFIVITQWFASWPLVAISF